MRQLFSPSFALTYTHTHFLQSISRLALKGTPTKLSPMCNENEDVCVLVIICNESDAVCVLNAICDENESVFCVLIAICDEKKSFDIAFISR